MSLKKVCCGVFPAAMAADWPRPFHLGTSNDGRRAFEKAMKGHDRVRLPVSIRLWLCLLQMAVSWSITDGGIPGSDSGLF